MRILCNTSFTHKILSLFAIFTLALPTSLYTQSKSLSSVLCDGAGVIPLCTIDQTEWILLGQESKGRAKGTWDAFTGKRDPHERHPQETAAREFAEESEFLMMSTDTAHKYIDLAQGNTLYVIINEKRREVIYITRFNVGTIEQFAQKFVNTPRTGSEEKDLVGLIAWNNFIDVFANTDIFASESSPESVQVKALVFIKDPGSPKGYRTLEQSIVIRPSRIKTLQSFAKDIFNHTNNYVEGDTPCVRFYEA